MEVEVEVEVEVEMEEGKEKKRKRQKDIVTDGGGWWMVEKKVLGFCTKKNQMKFR